MSVWKKKYHKFFRVKTALFSIFANNYFHIIRLISINIILYIFIRMINFQMYLKILIWDLVKYFIEIFWLLFFSFYFIVCPITTYFHPHNMINSPACVGLQCVDQIRIKQHLNLFFSLTCVHSGLKMAK